ncbi:spore coat protein U domain-containing protein [Rhodomicrobium lacus]|uniref:spore coat protein U domain-containing protein n=1 Tax=Rhodomicrobium lacus TaxID=2498452 RepID=UPI000F8CDBE3|nr:spore coat protein U domain-containing protein [Rhodomicrobium lacus]
MAVGLVGVSCAGMTVSDAKGGSQDIAITVVTTVKPSCSISNTSPVIDFGDLSKSGSVSVKIGLSCNSRFKFVFSSQNGGLALGTSKPVRAPFLAKVPYTLSYNLDTSAGAVADLCHSDNMIDGTSACVSETPPNSSALSKSLTLGFHWDSGEGVPLAGAYRDVLAFRVSPRL